MTPLDLAAAAASFVNFLIWLADLFK